MTIFNSPDDLYVYVVQTAQMLKQEKLTQAAEMLESVNSIFYTTASEWLGELGLATRAVEADFSIPEEIQKRLDEIMASVNDVWPKM